MLSACLYPDLLDISPPVFPNDVIERAKEILGALPGGSLGSYSESTGHLYCRKVGQLIKLSFLPEVFRFMNRCGFGRVEVASILVWK